MGWKRGLIAAGAGLLLALTAVPSAAAVLVEEGFEGEVAGGGRGKVVGTPHGRGWQAGIVEDSAENGAYLQYPASSLNPDAGSLELEIVRDEQEEWEGIFALVDEQGQSLAYATFFWEGNVYFRGKAAIEFGRTVDVPALWYTTVGKGDERRRYDGVFLSGVGKGSSVHLVFTWGKSAADCAVYINGRKLPAEVDTPFGMGEAIRKAQWLVIGAEPSGDTGASAQMNSIIEYVRIHDQAIDGAELHTPDRYASKLAPEVGSVTHDASLVAGFSGKLVAGNELHVTVEGTPGVTGTYDIAHFPDLDRKIALDWRGWGVHLEEKPFLEPDEIDIRDVEGYRVFVRKLPFNPLAPGQEPVAELDVKEQSYLAEDLEIDTPYYAAVVAVMKDGALRPVLLPVVQQPLVEGEPGVYTGVWQVGYQDHYPRAVVVGRLGQPGAATSLAGGATETFAVDPTLSIAVATNPSVLKADENSTAKVTVTVTDANGNAVPDHEISFLLATTSQYTGVVGGGAFTEQVGGALKTDLRGRTDLFGRVTATYVAGFAAKTAVIVARDMASNSTGAGHVQTFIQATAQLELEPALQTEAMAAGYEIAVTSSDKWLTADGKSQARITARVTLAGQPVEGHRVRFQVSSGTGQIRAVSELTGRNGEARAVYTAGTKIGLALITATDTTVDISGSVQIELRSDAPAKIAITIDPEKLPADGRSRADVTVLVTDINDNPNDNVEVEYAITEGGGDLKDKKGLTDRRGESANTYTAGRTPGTVSIEITVRSPVPTEEEIGKARDLAVAVTDSRFF